MAADRDPANWDLFFKLGCGRHEASGLWRRVEFFHGVCIICQRFFGMFYHPTAQVVVRVVILLALDDAKCVAILGRRMLRSCKIHTRIENLAGPKCWPLD